MRAMEELGQTWSGFQVPFAIDNTSFQQSVAKGRSRAQRLNVLVRAAYTLQIKYNFILMSYWISSEDNLLADHLSRDREEDFLRDVWATGFWKPGTVVQRHPEAGSVFTFAQDPGAVSSEVRDAVVQVEELRPGEADAVPPLPPRSPQPGSAVLAEELSDIVPEAQRPSTRIPPRTRRH